MAKYILKYWFEHGGTCLWSVNEDAKSKFNYPIDNNDLPISQELLDDLNTLEDEYHGYLDWDYPPDPSPWSEDQKSDFKRSANNAYEKLVLELGADFEIINRIDDCVN